METNSLFRVKFLLPLVILLFAGVACEKHVTPNKVERKLDDENWDIVNFYFVDTNITDAFTGDVFSFEEDGTVVIAGQWNTIGTWSVGLNKNPTKLYIGGFSQEPYSWMNDDWIVESISNEQMTLTDDSGTNELVFVLHED